MIFNSRFKPPWWLRNSHLQTIWPSLAKREANVDITHQRLDLPDGDFLDLAWVGEHHPDKPLIIVLHGLCGSIHSPYILNTLEAINEAGYRGVLMHFRGCGDQPNRMLRSFHAGDTSDLAFLVQYLQRKEPGITLGAVGYSLGGNVLLKWLGETETTQLNFAIGISVPFDLFKVLKRFSKGVSRVYSFYLLFCLNYGDGLFMKTVTVSYVGLGVSLILIIPIPPLSMALRMLMSIIKKQAVNNF